MLNQSILMGRLTKEPETKYLQGTDNSVTRFTLAVERDYKAAGEEKPKTDFINCVAWNKTGEFIAKYFPKGSMIAVVGSIETDSYTNRDGVKVYTTDLRVSKVSFTGEKRGSSNNSDQTPPPATQSETDGFMNIPDDIDEDLPWNR